jgi:hypothetical protein
MRRGVQEETVTFQGESLTYLQPGWHCENGDDGVLDGSDNDYGAIVRRIYPQTDAADEKVEA